MPADITPAPGDDEAAAILAAAEALWPRVVETDDSHERDRSVAWRFSGRWWHRDRFARAERPWS